MTDRKTVMSWLEGLTFDDWRDYHSDSEVQTIAKSALELLKEQQPMSVIVTWQNKDCKDGNCPSCGREISDIFHPKCCGYCGQAVKWE